MKKVSVIIPVYGVEKYIRETVASVLQQTYDNFELIIVDDESPDQSIAICQQFQDPRIKIVRQANRGLAGARNTGIRHASGDYVAFLDGDDLWQPNKLEKHVEHLERSPHLGISFSPSAMIDEASNFTGNYLRPQLQDITPGCLLCDNPVGNGSAAVVRRETLEAIRFQDNLHGVVEEFYFDETFRRAEDVDCWLRIALQTDWQIEGLPEALTLYRVNTGGLSANLGKQLEALTAVVEKANTYAPDFVQHWRSIARAYHLRYSARNAIRQQDGAIAVQFMHQALSAHWQLILKEPRRTVMTLIAAYLLWLIPRPVYHLIETLGNGAIGLRHRNTLEQNSPYPDQFKPSV